MRKTSIKFAILFGVLGTIEMVCARLVSSLSPLDWIFVGVGCLAFLFCGSAACIAIKEWP
jgi:hypothetical protein